MKMKTFFFSLSFSLSPVIYFVVVIEFWSHFYYKFFGKWVVHQNQTLTSNSPTFGWLVVERKKKKSVSLIHLLANSFSNFKHFNPVGDFLLKKIDGKDIQFPLTNAKAIKDVLFRAKFLIRNILLHLKLLKEKTFVSKIDWNLQKNR